MANIAVIGRSTPPFDASLLEKAAALGARCANAGHAVLSGACPGFAHAAVQAAFASGGKTVGYSPAADSGHHQNGFASPLDAFTHIQYFGEKEWSDVKNFTWRSAHLIDDADAVFCVDGSWGTLSEVALVFETEKPLGVLESPGASSFVKSLEETLARRRKQNVVYAKSPDALADAVFAQL
ncbi:MAG: hypothetical protein Q8P02_00445 [Candidatus Micrarchaeota archaeon]|nr:hypothetical protein [Candidatus Micrarchaeota archaeon]